MRAWTNYKVGHKTLQFTRPKNCFGALTRKSSHTRIVKHSSSSCW